MATPIENNTGGLQEILQMVQELPDGINADDFVKKTELQEAVDDALEQAKNSGEFDGKDGTSVTHTWSGTTLMVTSASGTSSANLKGDKGDTGSFDTSKIVNNFTTTEEGFVADARALKVLNDRLPTFWITPAEKMTIASMTNVQRTYTVSNSDRALPVAAFDQSSGNPLQIANFWKPSSTEITVQIFNLSKSTIADKYVVVAILEF